MRRRPRRPHEGIVDRWLFVRWAVESTFGSSAGCCCLPRCMPVMARHSAAAAKQAAPEHARHAAAAAHPASTLQGAVLLSPLPLTCSLPLLFCFLPWLRLKVPHHWRLRGRSDGSRLCLVVHGGAGRRGLLRVAVLGSDGTAWLGYYTLGQAGTAWLEHYTLR